MPRKKNSLSLSDRFASLRERALGEGSRLPLMTAIACSLGLIGLAAWGVPKLRERLRTQTIDAIAQATDDSTHGAVNYTELPAWFDEKRQSQVSSRVRSAVGDLSTIDQTRLSRAKDAILSTGWFEEIRQISLADGGGFLVDAKFLVPFAIVRHGEFDFLVTPEGRLMPMEWRAGHRPAQPHYVAILGATQPAPGAIGDRWQGADLAAGLELARAIASEAWFTQVAGIDLSRFSAENALVLVTQAGGHVVWGRAPDDRSVAEVPTETKLATLDYLFRSNGRIDAGGGRAIDLRGDLVTLRADARTASAEDPANVGESR
ncbi:MAG: hypothetical protein ACKO3W_07335 [bacterium]